jgi:hypothetical protein
MGRTELEMAFREVGVGGDRSIALSEELSEVWDADEVAVTAQSGFALRLLQAWEADDQALPGLFLIPAVADANVRGDLGDMCGRRVA